MSNTTQGRFKSKALSYVFTKTRHWMDECEKAIREAKIAVSWGAKLALSPLYALFRASRMVGHQLQGTVRNALLSLPFGHPDTRPAADAPIQTLVNLLEQLVVTVPSLTSAPSASIPRDWENSSEITPLAMASLQAFIPEAPELNPFQPSQSVPLWQQVGKVLSGLVHGFSQGMQGLRGTNPHRPSGNSAALCPTAPQPSLLTQIRKLGTLTVAKPDSDDLAVPRLRIQGVASQLASRELVLVTLGNQILDILSPRQQQQLQARIVWEIADYWQKRKCQERRFHSVQTRVAALQGVGTKVLTWAKGTIRDYRCLRVLAGQPSAVIHSGVALPLAGIKSAVIKSIGQTLQLRLPGNPKRSLPGLPALLGEANASPLALRPVLLLQQIQQIWNSFHRLPVIRAFFQQGDSSDLPRLPGSGQPLAFGMMLDLGLIRFLTQRFQAKQIWQWHEPSWLTLRDLGGADSEVDTLSVPEALYPGDFNPPPQPWFQSWLSPLKAMFQRLWQPIQWIWHHGLGFSPALPPSRQTLISESPNFPSISPGLRSRRPRPTNRTFSLRETVAAVIGNASISEQSVTILSLVSPSLIPETPDGMGLEFCPDWIEVESTAIGYVKSPLEQILDVLDQLFLWLETVTMRLWNCFWNWIQDQLRP